MKKNDILNYLAAAQSRCADDVAASSSEHNNITFLTALTQFIEHCEFDEDVLIPYVQFILFISDCIYAKEKTLRPVDNKDDIAFCQRWLQESGRYNESTFMATPVTEIAVENLMVLDGRYEDATEILEYIKNQEKDGRNIFLNPNHARPLRLFSNTAIQAVRQHPHCKAFIVELEEKQREYDSIALPDNFYGFLHEYLLQLRDIGRKNSTTWGFETGYYRTAKDYNGPQTKLEACQQARIQFFEKMSWCCSEQQLEALEHRKIRIPIDGIDNATLDAKFKFVAEGKDYFSCIILQQIYLWYMLMQQRPVTMIPFAVLAHRDAALYNLITPRSERFSDLLKDTFYYNIRLHRYLDPGEREPWYIYIRLLAIIMGVGYSRYGFPQEIRELPWVRNSMQIALLMPFFYKLTESFFNTIENLNRRRHPDPIALEAVEQPGAAQETLPYAMTIMNVLSASSLRRNGQYFLAQMTSDPVRKTVAMLLNLLTVCLIGYLMMVNIVGDNETESNHNCLAPRSR